MFRTLKYFPNGKEPEYTFFTDFDIASHFNGGIEDTYKRVIKEWGNNYKAMTEVSICLNLLCWDFYEKNNSISKIFSDLYYKSRDYFSIILLRITKRPLNIILKWQINYDIS